MVMSSRITVHQWIFCVHQGRSDTRIGTGIVFQESTSTDFWWLRRVGFEAVLHGA